MSAKKDNDLVAGRLSGRRSEPASALPSKPSGYGKSRLGLAPQTSEEVPEDVPQQASAPQGPFREAALSIVPDEQAMSRPHRLPAKGEAAGGSQEHNQTPSPIGGASAHSISTFHETYTHESQPVRDLLCSLWSHHDDRRWQVGFAAACAALLLIGWLALSPDKPVKPARAKAAGEPKLVAATPEVKPVATPEPTADPRPLRPRTGPRRTYTPPEPAAATDNAPDATDQQQGVGEVLELAASLLGRRGGKPAPAGPQTAAPKPTSSSGAAKPNASGPAPERYILRPPGFQLSGIMKMPQGMFANINGKYVTAGEHVNGARVVEIRDFVVVMELTTGERFLVGVSSGPSRSAGATVGGEDADGEESDDGEQASDEEEVDV